MNFKDAAEKNEQWIIEQRRFFHQCPELSEQEKNTTLESAWRRWDLSPTITRDLQA